MTSHRVLSISVCLLAAATAVRAQEAMTTLTLAERSSRSPAPPRRSRRRSRAKALSHLPWRRAEAALAQTSRLTKLVPANYASQILRGIVLSGATMRDLREPIFWLTVYTSGIIGLAVIRFKKTAE